MGAPGVVADVPFYRQRLGADGLPKPWTLADLRDYAGGASDPAAGRAPPGSRPALYVQLEGSEDVPVYLPLGPMELRGWARALAYAWRLWGVGAGDVVALYDYGSSPAVFLASGLYVPGLGRGAADLLRVTVVCNDGPASMAARMAEAVRCCRPRGIVLRADVARPLVSALAQAGVPAAEAGVAWAAVTTAEEAPSPHELAPLREALGVPVYRTWRADAALFLAPECPACSLFHVPRALYRLEELPEGVAVTAAFARDFPATRYLLEGAELAPPGCHADPRAWRLRP
ncbi:hypothetical protein HRbin24_01446 [bacterium HR24]|jgi:hypothetical protein|nr:hypothetical protein HRbin24_01446 [bacterium HR24]